MVYILLYKIESDNSFAILQEDSSVSPLAEEILVEAEILNASIQPNTRAVLSAASPPPKIAICSPETRLFAESHMFLSTFDHHDLEYGESSLASLVDTALDEVIKLMTS
jgi:hypothetical protein